MVFRANTTLFKKKQFVFVLEQATCFDGNFVVFLCVFYDVLILNRNVKNILLC
jgi:hypothetical protein